MSQEPHEIKAQRQRRLPLILIPVIAGLVGFGLAAVYMSRQGEQRAAGQQPQITNQSRPAAAATAQETPIPDTARAVPTPAPATGDSSILDIFGAGQQPAATTGQPLDEHWTVTVPRITIRLLLAAILATVLAFRPRKVLPLLQRNPYVAQTQILLAVVAASLMMIVGDSAARAFGIFAAASLVRFRTNIRDPKEITVLLISLAIGLGTGVGRWELSLVLTLFVLPLLWGLEYYEVMKLYRSMGLTVKSRNTDATQAALKRIFRRYKFNYELRQLDPPDAEEPVGCVAYHVSISVFVTTDQLNDEILAADRNNVEGIEWEQQKTSSYIYQ